MSVIVAIFLPLSAMWASTNVSNSNIAAPFLGSGGASTPTDRSNRSTGVRGFSTTIGTLDTLTNNTGSSSTVKEPGAHITVRPSGDSIDLELEMIGRSINVTRTYSINSA